MGRKVAVIGINYNYSTSMTRLLNKLRNSMHESNVCFFQCGSSGAELYQKILRLEVDKIIILDQFSGEEEDNLDVNFLSINERILILGIDPRFFIQKSLTGEIQKKYEQIIFQVRRLILNEIFLDSVAQV